MRKYLGTGWICDKNLENKIIYGNVYIYTLFIYSYLIIYIILFSRFDSFNGCEVAKFFLLQLNFSSCNEIQHESRL